ncbi:MAG: hypothetical protein WA584_19780 [Pyrinomonadaceae bacterium]
MKLINWVKFFALCALFLNLGLVSVKAQTQSNLQKLEGTKWKASASFPTPPDTWLWEFNYHIEKNNKIRAHIVVAVSGFRQKSNYNMTTKSYELVNELTTEVEREQNEIGTYQQTGNSIKMKFPSHQIDAKLDGNQMIGKITTYDGEKSVWSAELVSEKSTVTSKNNSDKSETKTVGTSGLADDLSDVGNSRLIFEAQASGTFKNILSEEITKGLIRIEIIDFQVDNLKAKFTLNSMSGELSGKIYDNEKLQLTGVGVIKGTLSDYKYQCSLNALVKNGTLTEGKYYCESKNGVIKGVLETALRKNN